MCCTQMHGASVPFVYLKLGKVLHFEERRRCFGRHVEVAVDPQCTDEVSKVNMLCYAYIPVWRSVCDLSYTEHKRQAWSPKK